MNEQLRPPALPVTTQAAEGLPRRRWSVGEIEEMVANGIIAEDERFELIGGEVVPTSPKGNRHELVNKALQQYWFPLIAGSQIDLITETTLRTSADTYVEPDFLFFPRSVQLADVRGPVILLLVEVAEKSLAYDLSRKAEIYAALGVRAYWVIDALRLMTRVHLEPTAGGYAAKEDFGADGSLVPHLVPALAVALGALELH